MKKLSIKKCPNQESLPVPSLGMSEQNFKIYLRVKPVPQDESSNQILKVHSRDRVEVVSPYYAGNDAEKLYTFEEVFDGGANNQYVFNKTMAVPIMNVLQGYNSTVFIYGMTGSGKTYTMFGSLSGGPSLKGKQSQQGLVSLTIDHIFSEINKQQQVKSKIVVSFYEIYNENIRDLLQEEQNTLTIMEDPIHGICINGLVQISAINESHIKNVILSGIEKRSINATKSNQVSSRSHAILQFMIRRYRNSSNNNDISVMESKFFMIDIAGNEKTCHNQSRRFIEGVNINKSLLTLGKCLSVLAERKGAYVPFRDSKLTRILKESLGGNSKTVMIACVSPDRKFYEETLNTLKYSSIAKKIKNKGVKHNIKIITKNEIPESLNTGKSGVGGHDGNGYQERIKQVCTEFMMALETKARIQTIIESLQTSLKENEELLVKQNQVDRISCEKNIQKLGEVMKQIVAVYEKQVGKINKIYEELMTKIDESVHSRKSGENQSAEVAHLKQIIHEQNTKLQQYNRILYNRSSKKKPKKSSIFNFNKSLVRDQENRGSCSMGWSPEFQKENSLQVINMEVLEHQRKSSKPKQLIINFQQQSGQRTPVYTLNSSNTSMNSSQDKLKIRPQKQIVINLNLQKSQGKLNQSNRELFVKKLKETEKKVSVVQSHEIASLLEEHETYRYELGNAELSMIRKLKFFQREKTREKSKSINKVLAGSQTKNKGIFRKF